MRDLDKFEEMFMIFASSLAQFGSSIEEAEFSGEVGYISNKTSDMLQELYSETLKNIEEVRKYQKVK
jgi:hypothetical protein